MSNNRVIWFEGMFLQPQHFQQQDRFIEHIINAKQKMTDNYHWGVTSLVLDSNLLKNNQVGITRCEGIFPDGTPFNIPDNDHRPRPYKIPQDLQSSLLFLALPLRQADTAEVGESDSRGLYRYQVDHIMVRDHIADSSDQTVELPLGSLNCRLLSEQDDLSGYSYLPIAKINQSRTHTGLQLDEQFIFPTLTIHSDCFLSSLIKELCNLMSYRADSLVARLTECKQVPSTEDLIMLQVVNRYIPLVEHYCHKKPLHPEQLYCLLVQIIGELSALVSSNRRAPQLPLYQHDDLFNVFTVIKSEMTQVLSKVLGHNTVHIQLEERSNGLWVGQLTDKSLIQSSLFVLAVYADVPAETLYRLLPTQIKVGAVETVYQLVSRALPGIEVAKIPVPKPIPYQSGHCYFKLNSMSPLWQEIASSSGLAFHVGDRYPGLQLDLWAIKGEE